MLAPAPVCDADGDVVKLIIADSAARAFEVGGCDEGEDAGGRVDGESGGVGPACDGEGECVVVRVGRVGVHDEGGVFGHVDRLAVEDVGC